MKAARFFAAFFGIVCAAFVAIGTAAAIYTGDPLWQPAAFGAVAWAVLALAATALNWAIDRAFDWSDR
ncbi:hypothetical protein A5742_25395 [Mycolicibacterium fortuitum]|uniref:Uncharacterized protein n=1 Tax=Mycolicibacterium fortuitum TaxID=1766 RepID=A0ABD6QNA3_MYCFO|nr:hypothetical protein [Mycolicibacterium fortuitum]OMC46871.1 hypothetical protein A5742_25395 [Mycolicibacterium fortuitum]